MFFIFFTSIGAFAAIFFKDYQNHKEDVKQVELYIINTIDKPLQRMNLIDIKAILKTVSNSNPYIEVCLKHNGTTIKSSDLINCSNFEFKKHLITFSSDYYELAVFKKRVFPKELALMILISIIYILFVATQISNSSKNLRKDLQKAIIDNHEQEPLILEFKSIKKTYEEYSRLKIEEIRNAVSKQVAHDIRSPLAALEMAVENTKDINEESRLIITSATNRINDIANDLIENNRIEPEHQKTPSVKETKKVLLASICSPIVSEKRMQYRNKANIDIQLVTEPSAYSLFSKINSNILKRILSNLINNSAEAIPSQKKGVIKLKIKKFEDLACIEIQDNGKGIPASLIKKLGKNAISLGKDHGQGLGISHAYSTISKWGGSMQFKSTFGEGTTVRILLPMAEPPKTYVHQIKVFRSSTIAIVDDDQSIHNIWKQRLGSKHEFVHFTDPELFLKTVQDGKIFDAYFIDYEFIGHQLNGIDLVSAITDRKNAYLVTSHYEEPDIIQSCEEYEIGLIPKSMAPLVPIQFLERQKSTHDIVLIDDDELIHSSWRLVNKRKGINIHHFYDVESFIQSSSQFDSKIPIFIDQYLDNQQLGTVESEKIFDLGFDNITLATGDISVSPPTWIKTVRDKSFPSEQV